MRTIIIDGIAVLGSRSLYRYSRVGKTATGWSMVILVIILPFDGGF